MHTSEHRLRRLATALLDQRGVPAAVAWLQADPLIAAEVRGLSSHGLMRRARCDSRLADPVARWRHRWRSAGFLRVDGQRALCAATPTNALTGRIGTTGIAIAALRDTNHLGTLAYYLANPASCGLIGILLTGKALAHPHGGSQALLGTNPVSNGIPTGEMIFASDLATRPVPMRRIHALRSEPLPKGWPVGAIDLPTQDAEAAEFGALSPFGAAKGYGLGLAFKRKVALVARSELAPKVPETLDAPDPATKGDRLILIDPGAARRGAARLSRRASHPANPGTPVAIPGDGAVRRRAAALCGEIDIPKPLLDELRGLCSCGFGPRKTSGGEEEWSISARSGPRGSLSSALASAGHWGGSPRAWGNGRWSSPIRGWRARLISTPWCRT